VALLASSLGAAPLFRFDQIARTAEGIDSASGKRWLRFQLGDEAAARIAAFTQAAAGRGLAGVVGGEVACAHKIREPIHEKAIQLSCCNPNACDRWKTLVRPE
jgi:hypothetical protein